MRLASGGAAHVLLVRDRAAPPPGRLLALKVLQPSLALNDEFLQMFFTEARIASHLQHPNVVHIAGFGQVDGVHCLAMEYVFGASLADVLRASARAHRPLSVGVLLSLTASICDALHYAHDLVDEKERPLGLVHRDVTPQNILIGFNGIPKLTDFGIAKATGRGWETQAGIVKGKFAYMSPEQALGRPVDRRSDIFGVGIVLWEALTGHALFKGTQPTEVISAIRDQPIEAPSQVVPGLTPIVDEIVLRALQRTPRRRYQSADEMGAEIRDLIRRAGVTIDAQAISKELAQIYGDVIVDRAFALRTAMSGRSDLAELARILGAHVVDDRLLPDLRARARPSSATRPARPAPAPSRPAPTPRPVGWQDNTAAEEIDELLRMLSTEDVTVGEVPSDFRQRFEADDEAAEALGRVELDVPIEAEDELLSQTGELEPRAVSSWEDGDSDGDHEVPPEAVPAALEAPGPAYRPATEPPAPAGPPGPSADLDPRIADIPDEEAPTQLVTPPPSRAPTPSPSAPAPPEVQPSYLATDPTTDSLAPKPGLHVRWAPLLLGALSLLGVGVALGVWLGRS